MNWIKETFKILKMDGHSNWIKDLEQESNHFMDGIWYGVDEWDIHIFDLKEWGVTEYKYGIDVYTCELNDNGHIETKDHVGTMYTNSDKLSEDNVWIKYSKGEIE